MIFATHSDFIFDDIYSHYGLFDEVHLANKQGLNNGWNKDS